MNGANGANELFIGANDKNTNQLNFHWAELEAGK